MIEGDWSAEPLERDRPDRPPARDPGGVVLINAFEVLPDTNEPMIAGYLRAATIAARGS
jgi:hypothetical protein